MTNAISFTYYPSPHLLVNSLRKLFSALIVAFIVGAIGASMVSAKENVRVSRSTTVLPLAEAAAEAFNGDQSDFQVLVTGGGTGVGIKNTAEGNSDEEFEN